MEASLSNRNIFDSYYEKYDSWYDKNEPAFLSELEALKKAVPAEGNALEIGVGTGRFAASLGIRYGIDPSENMIRIAKDRGIEAKTGYGEALPYADGFFDYAVIINTLCFVQKPKKVLRETNRILRNKGKIILGLIDRNSFLGKFYREKNSAFYSVAEFISVEEAVSILQEAGFEKESFYQTLFRMPEQITKIEKPLSGYGKGGFVVITGIKAD
jgi:ubiquinone/menaquinone biosynthesis C-methylase UbiE